MDEEKAWIEAVHRWLVLQGMNLDIEDLDRERALLMALYRAARRSEREDDKKK
jgi:hypothetical protein